MAAALGGLLVRLSFSDPAVAQSFFGELLLAVLLTAYVGGLGPGLLATAIAGAGAQVLLFQPTLEFGVEGSGEAVQWLIFIVSGVLVSLLTESLHRARESIATRATTIDRTQLKVRAAFAAGVLCTAGIGLASFISVSRLREDTERLEHSHEVISALREMRVEMNALQGTAARYALKPAPEFEEAHRWEQSQLRETLARLDRQTGNDAAEAEALARIAPLVRRHMDLAGEAFILARSMTLAALLGSPVMSESERLRQEVSTLLGNWERAERMQLMDLKEITRRTARNVAAVTVAGGGLVVAFVIVLLVAISRDFAGSRRADQALQEAQLQLEARVAARTAELEQSNAALRESQANVAAIVASAADGIITFDETGLIESANPAALTIFGWTKGELIGLNVAVIIPAAASTGEARSPGRWWRETGGAVEARGTVTQGRRQDGGSVPLEVTVTETRSGGAPRHVAFLRDITARNQTEVEIAGRLQAEALLTRLTKALPGAIYIMRSGVDGHISIPYASAGWSEMTGLSPAQIRDDATPVLRAIHPDDLPDYEAAEADAARRMGPFVAEFRVRHPERGYIWVDARSLPELQPDGSLLWYGYTADITARRRAETALRESEERMRLASEAANIGVWDSDLKTGEVVWSRQQERIMGFEPGTFSGRIQDFLALIKPEYREIHAQARRDALENDGVFSAELCFQLRDGRLRWGLLRGQVSRDEAGRPERLIGVDIDITERRMAEAALDHERALLRAVFDVLPDSIYVKDTESRFLMANTACAQHLGAASTADVMGKTDADFYPPEMAVRFRATELAVLAGQAVRNREGTFVRPDGSRVVILTTKIQLRDAQGNVVGILGTAREITERKIAMQALRESEERFSRAFRSSPAAIAISRRRDLINIEVNDAFLRLFECTREEIVGRTLIQAGLLREETVQSLRSQLTVTGEVNNVELPVFSRTGRPLHVAVSIRVLELGGEPCSLATVVDITERKRAETRTAVQHAVTQVLADGAPLSETGRRIIEIVCQRLGWDTGELWLTDPTNRMLQCADIWQVPAAPLDAFVTASRTLTWRKGQGVPGAVWSSNAPVWIPDVTVDERFVRRDLATQAGLKSGVGVPVRLRGDVIGVLNFFSVRSHPVDADLLATFAAIGLQIGQFVERKRLANQFRQSQKMEAIGTLAGGIAHDFNNVLGAIGGYTELARMQTRDNPEVVEYLQAVSEGCRRAADLVRQILAFSRQQEQQRKLMQLWPIVDEALKLLRAAIPSTITFETAVAHRGPAVLADPTQIHQVIMNLATNSAHAMRDAPGRLSVTLEEFAVTEALAAIHPGLHAGPYLRLTIADTGHGMDAATLERIFEPFFTTKAPGEGTGLGLAVVHGIMQAHDGVVTVQSEPGQGTRFDLYFPAHLSPTPESPEAGQETPRGQGERILVVEDEIPLALMVKAVLQRLGYVVDLHTNPVEAVKALRTGPQQYDLVLTDLAMPGMTGTDLARQMLELRPDLPIVLTTGYSATLTPERARALGLREMVLKPLMSHALGDLVHRVLHSEPPGRNEAVQPSGPNV
ncbi:PAS domain S-box protein [Horticoccus sp. 23ND18S-11]|uniref:PAS domain S-box protein n=1 Tax=Horticoccus sp. 23ND18S-11 TaxID=3391832 RepID=UPI0039C916F8